MLADLTPAQILTRTKDLVGELRTKVEAALSTINALQLAVQALEADAGNAAEVASLAQEVHTAVQGVADLFATPPVAAAVSAPLRS